MCVVVVFANSTRFHQIQVASSQCADLSLIADLTLEERESFDLQEDLGRRHRIWSLDALASFDHGHE
jgi:hypothetical protein